MKIKDIHSICYKFAKEHIGIKSFTFGIPSKVEGAGERPYPMVVWEYPGLVEYDGNYGWSVKFDMCILDNDQRKDELTRINNCDTLAEDFFAYLDNEDAVSLSSFSVTQLSHFSDDDATGVRISVGMTVSGIPTCVDDSQYDPSKVIDGSSSLPIIQDIVGERDLPIISFEPEPEYIHTEYAESEGDCYLDLGVKPSEDLEYSITFAITDTSIEEQAVMGSSSVGKRTLIGMQWGQLWHQLGEADWMQKAADNKTHIANTDPAIGHFFLDADNRSTPQGSTYADGNLYLFAENYDGVASNFAKARVYSIQINGMDLQPVIRMPEGKVVFRDEASGTVIEPVVGELHPKPIR